MPRYIVKIKDEETDEDPYMEWSTVVDAPTSNLYPLDIFMEWYEWRYNAPSNELSERLVRVEETGTSSQLGDTAKTLIEGNRAGEKESELSLKELIKKYKHKED